MANDIFDDIKLQFEQFLSLVGNALANEKEIHIIKNKLRRHFNTTSISYLCSADFRSFLHHIQNLFNKNNKTTKFFTLLATFDEQLKKHNIKLLRSHRSSNETSSPIHYNELVKTISSTDEKPVNPSSESPTIIPLQSSSSSTTNEHNTSASIKQTVDQPAELCPNIILVLNKSPLAITNEESKMIPNSVNTSEYEMKRKKKISKLERQLSSLSKMIRQLEEKDMSLDEMRYCDIYLVESNLKKQAYDIYTKLAELKNQSSSVERILDQPVTLTETEIDHPVIHKALEDMVNQTKFLPSFNDVLETVEKANDKHKLNLSVDARKSLAEQSFKIIGKKVKNRRMADFNDIMNSRLPEDFDIERNDPALDNDEIEETLLTNEREASNKTDKILEEFSQIDPDLEPEIDIESSEESNDEEEKGEEEEDDDDDEVEPESGANVEPFDNKSDENQYDIVDILPPFSSKSSSPSPSNATETIDSRDHVEATVEFSVSDRRLTVLTTASIPLKRAARHPFVPMTPKSDPEVYTILDDDDIQESESIAIIKEHKVHTIIPRRREQHTSTDETLYTIYKQRITSNDLSTAPKRSVSDIESSKSKKCKEITEIVILD